ncbi:MAG: DUF4240 domain-containing protein [Saprospiraceae bacterium]|nr:DUF4240 domain-containing protein [Saprospiraceae bacterium]MCF8251163.1 DUF4240 domain-containing protein [Saprospiraceae bacterium]MCF8281886.1 DUF4240 domain-containing protein [Bacteroidales bacterium]MCF8312975.1 DUF4240 domain-containing protein [Saprospiraceae bacterium]MCF8441422.1 DUF4240 domain-containing protein [Saprospiraceae bacterium]
MTTLLEMPLHDVVPSLLKDLKAKYPKAMLRIEAENGLHAGGMDEAQFWAIIALLDWEQPNREDVLAPAVLALSEFDKADIFRFHDLLNEKLYALDGKRFAVQLGSNRYAPQAGKYFSVDDFLYSRCAVVANGRAFYESVLQNPKRMPKEFTFESLLYLPERAWERTTGRDDYDYFPETWYETFSNPEGWDGIVPLKERLRNG